MRVAKNRTAPWPYISLYGVLLVIAGVVGDTLVDQASHSAFLNGVGFGIVMIVLGLLHRQGRLWTLPAAMSATAMFLLTFLWRMMVYLTQQEQDQITKTPVIILLTALSAASLLLFITLYKSFRK